MKLHRAVRRQASQVDLLERGVRRRIVVRDDDVHYSCGVSSTLGELAAGSVKKRASFFRPGSWSSRHVEYSALHFSLTPKSELSSWGSTSLCSIFNRP